MVAALTMVGSSLPSPKKVFPTLVLLMLGNSEVGGWSNGAGTMEAIFWGNARWRGNMGDAEPGCILAQPLQENATNKTICDGATPETSANCCGPWLGADLESGMVSRFAEAHASDQIRLIIRFDFMLVLWWRQRDTQQPTE